MLLVLLRLTVVPDQFDQVLKTVRSTLGRTRAVSGCVSCDVYVNADESNELLYVEQWASEEGLGRHLRNNCWKSLFAVMEASAEPPELRFIRSDGSRGLEYLKELRLDRD